MVNSLRNAKSASSYFPQENLKKVQNGWVSQDDINKGRLEGMGKLITFTSCKSSQFQKETQ